MPVGKDAVVLNEGKTKIIRAHPEDPRLVVVESKDRITAFNAERSNELEGKARLSNFTNAAIYQYLNDLGLKTHFVATAGEKAFIAERCSMIPLEWIIRRVATGSFLKRNPGVKQGFRFSPPKLEITLKDDAQGDPIWTEEMVIESGMNIGGVHIGRAEVREMGRVAVVIFEVLEKTWAAQGCTLVDMKIEFGVNPEGKIVLSDVIDSDSWRLWPQGDSRLQLDKQFYRDLKEVTPEALQQLKKNFATTNEYLKKFRTEPKGRVVVVMGSFSDKDHGQKIQQAVMDLGIPCHVEVCSAHKQTVEALDVIHQYEGDGIPTVFIAVAGMSNGLGPVTAGNTTYPVINCPPPDATWSHADVWSSLRVPPGIACSTVMNPTNAALHAANILGLLDHVVWCRLRIKQLTNDLKLREKGAEQKVENKAKKDTLFLKNLNETQKMIGSGGDEMMDSTNGSN